MNELLTFLENQNKLNRAWTKEETQIYRRMNDQLLEELNKTLTPPLCKKTGRLGIFCFGQCGDLATATGVLKYMDTMFPNKELIWYCNFPNADLLRFSPVSEIRRWPWAGNGLPLNCPDYDKFLCNSDNRLNKELAAQYPETADLEDGYFPAPHMLPPEKQGTEYTGCAKMIFGVPAHEEWHPVLAWSEEEKVLIENFANKLPPNRKTILLETFAGSGQSPYWDEALTRKIMQICRLRLGKVNFIFASHKHKGGINNGGLPNSMFFDEEGCVGAEEFTARQAGVLINYADLMICMSSGISVTTSAWGLKATPKLQYCGSRKCSTVGIALGEIVLVESDFKVREVADAEFFCRLEEMLMEI